MELNTILIAVIAFLLGILISVGLYIRLLKKFVDRRAKPREPIPQQGQTKGPAAQNIPADQVLELKEDPPEVEKTIKMKIAGESQCVNHEDRHGHGLCAICMEAFCEECLIENEHLHFCREHYMLFNENQWEVIETVRTNPDKADESMYLYEFKGHLWDQEKLPTIVTTHYQINTENNEIESQISLMVPQEKQEKLAQEIKSFKKPS
jgi:hypothetical protein